jgi:2-polyprenyl-3-methyl-5-hydroxy-6-metoxy-1,4-benzoquinol methylase
MKNEKRNFDQEAALWDQNPGRVKVVADIAQTIIGEVKPNLAMDVLDFGCGTGLLTLALQPIVHSITGVDSSQGMLDVFRRKISDGSLPNVSARYLDLDRGDVLTGSYHLVVSSMTLHHIKNVDPLIRQFHQILHPSGMLCIADLDPDDGWFHSENDGVFHFGFDREEMKRRLVQAGFNDIRVTQAAQLEKPVEDGSMRLFTVFLIIGCK